MSGTIEDGGTFGGAGASLVKSGTGTLTLSGVNTYSGGTTVTGGLINFTAGNNLGTGAITLNGGGLQWAAGNTLDISARLAPLGAAGGTFDTNGNNVSFATGLSGSGGLTKAGAGTLTLLAANSYTGGTTVLGGILAGTTASLQGNILNNAAVTFIRRHGTYAGSMSGSGSLAKTGAGTLILTGANSYCGGTTVSGGILQGNTAEPAGQHPQQCLRGVQPDRRRHLCRHHVGHRQPRRCRAAARSTSPATTPTPAARRSMAGTLAVNGSLAEQRHGRRGRHPGRQRHDRRQRGRQRRHARARQLDRHAHRQRQLHPERPAAPTRSRPMPRARATASMSAARRPINGGTVQVLAAAGSYANSTTYTIVNATGGVSGTYSGVTSNFAFLTPSLTYDANNVFLTLALGTDRLPPASAARRPTRARSAPRSTRSSPPPRATSPRC